MIIAIDPGYSATGSGSAVAVFRETLPNVPVLCEVFFDRPEEPRDRVRHDASDAIVVWETPQVDSRSRRSTQSIVKLAAEGGELAGMYAQANSALICRVTPSEWKGSVPKPIAHGRMWARLLPHERDLLGGDATLDAIDVAKRKGALERWAKEGARYYPRTWHAHNILDAVGIGLYLIGNRA